MSISGFEKWLGDEPSQRTIHEIVGQLAGAAKILIWENKRKATVASRSLDELVSLFVLFLRDPNNFGARVGGKKAAQKLLGSMESEGLIAYGSDLSLKAWQLTKRALRQYMKSKRRTNAG